MSALRAVADGLLKLGSTSLKADLLGELNPVGRTESDN